MVLVVISLIKNRLGTFFLETTLVDDRQVSGQNTNYVITFAHLPGIRAYSNRSWCKSIRKGHTYAKMSFKFVQSHTQSVFIFQQSTYVQVTKTQTTRAQCRRNHHVRI